MNHAAICIIGMHRSGTSCLAGSLQAAGLQLGEVVEEAPHNRKGNREHLEIRALNDAVLATSGGAWSEPPDSLTWTAGQAKVRDALVARLASLPGPAWGFKDPRSTIVLPFWQAGIPGLRLVATYRNPVAVAQSLVARDRLSFDDGLRLWLAYNRSVLTWLRRCGGPLVSFDVSRDEYLDAVERSMRRLGIGGPGSSPAGARCFFDEDLRHQRGAAAGPQRGVPAEVAGIFEQLEDYYRREAA